jgi:hypothetical protein
VTRSAPRKIPAPPADAPRAPSTATDWPQLTQPTEWP